MVAYGPGNSHVGIAISANSNNSLSVGAFSPKSDYMRIQSIEARSATVPGYVSANNRRRAKYVQIFKTNAGGSTRTRKFATVYLGEPTSGGQWGEGTGGAALKINYLFWTGRTVWVQEPGRAPHKEKEWGSTSVEIPLFIYIKNNRLDAYTLATAINGRANYVDRKAVGVSKLYPGFASGTKTCKTGYGTYKAA